MSELGFLYDTHIAQLMFSPTGEVINYSSRERLMKFVEWFSFLCLNVICSIYDTKCDVISFDRSILRISWSMQWYDYFNMSNSWIRLSQFHSSDKHKYLFLVKIHSKSKWRGTKFCTSLLMFRVSSDLDFYFAAFDAESRASKI